MILECFKQFHQRTTGSSFATATYNIHGKKVKLNEILTTTASFKYTLTFLKIDFISKTKTKYNNQKKVMLAMLYTYVRYLPRKTFLKLFHR